MPENDVTILKGIVGSTAYGLAHEGSDVDRLGMFVAPTIAFHGLHLPTRAAATHVHKDGGDYTEHEVGKYLSLLLACNPTVTELLWLPDELYEVVTPEGLSLISMREKFLSAKAVRDAYFGYAAQQFHKLQQRRDSFSSDTKHRTEKHARHLKRLCWQGFTLYSTGVLPITIENPEAYFEFGRKVAELPEYAIALMESYRYRFDETKSVLPAQPDEEWANAWLIETRARHYAGDVYAHGKVHESLPSVVRAQNYLDNLIANGLIGYRHVSDVKRALRELTALFEVRDAGTSNN